MKANASIMSKRQQEVNHSARSHLFVGLDVPQKTLTVSYGSAEREAEVVALGTPRLCQRRAVLRQKSKHFSHTRDSDPTKPIKLGSSVSSGTQGRSAGECDLSLFLQQKS